MRALFLLVGLLFDLIVLAVSGAVIYIVFQPELLDHLNELLETQLSTQNGRLEVVAVAGVFFLLSFRSVFLLLSRGGRPEVLVVDQPGGRVTLSHGTIESVLRRLVESSRSGVSLNRARVNASGGGLDILMKIEMDLVDVNLKEYSSDLELLIREHFKNQIGLEINRVNIMAEHNAPFSGEQGA